MKKLFILLFAVLFAACTCEPPEEQPIQYKLTVMFRGLGHIDLNPKSTDGLYDAGTEVTVTATPEPGWHFARWGENNVDDNILIVTMNQNVELTAVFEENEQRPEPIEIDVDFELRADKWKELFGVAEFEATVDGLYQIGVTAEYSGPEDDQNDESFYLRLEKDGAEILPVDGMAGFGGDHVVFDDKAVSGEELVNGGLWKIDAGLYRINAYHLKTKDDSIDPPNSVKFRRFIISYQ